MKKNAKLEEYKAIKIFTRIIIAISFIHSLNACHLNINLDSILIDENDEI
jgi:serine/threonine protein kinase